MIPAIILLLLGASAGCAPDREAAARRFPIGIYSVEDPGHLARLREDGFDTFFPDAHTREDLRGLAKEAKRLGMRMVLSPRRDAPSDQTHAWPVAAWYLQDEPDVNGVSVSELEKISDKTRAWDPSRPQTFVVGQGGAAKPYAHIADILMLDWYPVPHLPLDSVADHLDLALSYMPKGKPLWMVLQAFDWRDEPQKDPKKPRVGRFPDHAEIRFMSYASVLHGAGGLFYFRLRRPSGRTLFEYPEMWRAVSRVTREFKSLQPILEGGRRVPLPFPPNPDGVEAGTWRYRGRDYVVVLNRRRDAYQKLPDELLKSAWRPLFELRRDPRDLLKPMYGAYYLRPYQVMVFEGPFSLKRFLDPGTR